MLWNHEKKRTSICCKKGKIKLEAWRQPQIDSENESETFAARIHDMWKENTTEGRLLRQYARPLNNALALASQVVEETNVTGDRHTWMPNVVIKGKLYHKMPYSLMPARGETPRFAQIYVYDPEQDEGAEAHIRLGHMTLQSGTTVATKRMQPVRSRLCPSM
jgi:hypothetical protein